MILPPFFIPRNGNITGADAVKNDKTGQVPDAGKAVPVVGSALSQLTELATGRRQRAKASQHVKLRPGR